MACCMPKNLERVAIYISKGTICSKDVKCEYAGDFRKLKYEREINN